MGLCAGGSNPCIITRGITDNVQWTTYRELPQPEYVLSEGFTDDSKGQIWLQGLKDGNEKARKFFGSQRDQFWAVGRSDAASFDSMRDKACSFSDMFCGSKMAW